MPEIEESTRMRRKCRKEKKVTEREENVREKKMPEREENTRMRRKCRKEKKIAEKDTSEETTTT